MAVLEFATAEQRIVVTHDVSTMVPGMNEQLRRLGRCAPILFIPDSLSAGSVIEEITIEQVAAEVARLRERIEDLELSLIHI